MMVPENKNYPGDQNTEDTENGHGLSGGHFLLGCLQGFWKGFSQPPPREVVL